MSRAPLEVRLFVELGQAGVFDVEVDRGGGYEVNAARGFLATATWMSIESGQVEDASPAHLSGVKADRHTAAVRSVALLSDHHKGRDGQPSAIGSFTPR